MKESGASTGSARKQLKTSLTEARQASHQEGNSHLLTLHVKQLKDYCMCPLFYRFKHIENVDADPDIDELLKLCIHKVADFMLYMTQDRLPTRADVRYTYNVVLKSVVGKKRLKSLSPKSIARGLEQVLAIHEFLKQTELYPIIVGHKYSIRFDNVEIIGRIDAICRNAGNDLELLMFSDENPANPDLPLSSDIEVITAWAACKKMVSRPVTRATVFYLTTGTSSEAAIQSNDTKGMEHIVRSVSKAIAEGIFYPSIGGCRRGCPYRVLCTGGHWLFEYIPKLQS